MRKKSTYVILIIILTVFFLVLFLLFGLSSIKQGNYESTIIVGDHTVWNYQNQKWRNLSTTASLQKLNWQKYNIYLNNEKFGQYYLWNDNGWYAFDDKKNAVSLDGNLLAIQSNYDIDVFSFKEESIDNMSYVHKVLKDQDLSISSQFTTSYKITIDFDHDGEREDFYLISNAFAMDFSPEKIFSLVFMVADDNIYPIYTDVSENRSFNGCKPFFTSFLDVDHDGVSEFILSCGRYSVGEQLDMLYHYDHGDFKILISNQ